MVSRVGVFIVFFFVFEDEIKVMRVNLVKIVWFTRGR